MPDDDPLFVRSGTFLPRTVCSARPPSKPASWRRYALQPPTAPGETLAECETAVEQRRSDEAEENQGASVGTSQDAGSGSS
jgi:hypothetical protein